MLMDCCVAPKSIVMVSLLYMSDNFCYTKHINNLSIKSVARDWPHDLPATCFV